MAEKRKRCDSLFSFFCNIKTNKFWLWAAGVIAQRRIQTLLRFGCQITMITPECTDILRQHAEQKCITACFRTYQADDCASFDIVLAATSDHTVNEAIVMDVKHTIFLSMRAIAKNYVIFTFPLSCNRTMSSLALHPAAFNTNKPVVLPSVLTI